MCWDYWLDRKVVGSWDRLRKPKSEEKTTSLWELVGVEKRALEEGLKRRAWWLHKPWGSDINLGLIMLPSLPPIKLNVGFVLTHPTRTLDFRVALPSISPLLTLPHYYIQFQPQGTLISLFIRFKDIWLAAKVRLVWLISYRKFVNLTKFRLIPRDINLTIFDYYKNSWNFNFLVVLI